jgi:undecaprenyl-diphosphatase
VPPISYFQAGVLGVLQGLSELFPISSLGHSVVLPQALGWDIHQNHDYFVTFLVATHLATRARAHPPCLHDEFAVIRVC